MALILRTLVLYFFTPFIYTISLPSYPFTSLPIYHNSYLSHSHAPYYLFTTPNLHYLTIYATHPSELVSQVPPQRHKIISLLVLPLLWQLLSSCVRNSGTPLHKSTCHLATEIKVVLGDALMDAACINSKVTLPMRESLAAMLNM